MGEGANRTLSISIEYKRRGTGGYAATDAAPVADAGRAPAKSKPRARRARTGRLGRWEALVAGLRCFRGWGLRFDHGGRGCGSGGEDGCLGAAFQKLLLPEPIESCLVTDISRHKKLLSMNLVGMRTVM